MRYKCNTYSYSYISIKEDISLDIHDLIIKWWLHGCITTDDLQTVLSFIIFGTWRVKTGAFSGDQPMNIAAIFIWLVVWNMNFIFPYIGNNHHPNWRTHIFQRGGYTTNQSCSFLGLRLFDPYRQSRMIKKMLSRDKSARFFYGTAKEPFNRQFRDVLGISTSPLTMV